jgi:hypothetical protein
MRELWPEREIQIGLASLLDWRRIPVTTGPTRYYTFFDGESGLLDRIEIPFAREVKLGSFSLGDGSIICG